MARSWTIGSSLDCDLVVDRPMVSGHHCRLTREGDDFLLEDLTSTNGTYVNGERVKAPVGVRRADVITLGQTQPMPWPDDAGAVLPSRVLRIGREPDNDLVVNLPTGSGYHARVVWEGKPGEAVVEDLNSSNGTAVGSSDRKVTRSVFRAGDVIHLGSHPLPAARVFEALGSAPVSTPGVGTSPPEPSGAALREEWDAAWQPAWRPAVLLAQAPVAALLLVLATHFDPKALTVPEGWAGGTRSLAALLFRLGLAAVAFGLTSAVVLSPSGDAISRGGPVRLLARAAVLGIFCGLQCFVAWGIVAVGSELKGAATASLLLLWLASGVGLAMGLVVARIAPRPAPAWACVVLVLLPLWFLGGERPRLPAMPGWARVTAGALPSRWVFEGLLLLESGRRTPPTIPSGSGPVGDLAEPYFPAQTERMGVRAAAMALGVMLLGWGAASGLGSASRGWHGLSILSAAEGRN